MSRGQFSLDIPHICGEDIPVTVQWDQDHGTFMDPPSYDEDYDYPSHCGKCGIDLTHDDLFLSAIESASREYDGDRGDFMPGDDIDYEPFE